MLDITKVESQNEVYVSGTLSELDIVEGTTKDGREWIRGTAKIRVDQEVNGLMTENEITDRMFSMRLKKDGTKNTVYDKILSYKDFTSLASAEENFPATKITIPKAKLEENVYMDNNNEIRSNWQISGNFLNVKNNSDEEAAKFTLSGVIGKMRSELDREGDETGRLLISFVIIGYGGKANVVELIAEGSKKEHIEQNWNEGDTVRLTGRICSVNKVTTILEEQGFGEPIKREKHEVRKELIITGGTRTGLEEALSYDADSIKNALKDRAARNEELKNNSKSKPSKPAVSNSFDF